MIPDADIDYQYLTNFKLIGKGIFGVVYKASYLGTDVAVKECHPLIKQYGFDFEKVFNREVTILKECRHPNIVQYMGTCIHEDKFYIITEYVKNDNLKTWITERIDELPWKLRVNFAIDIARALAYLHSKNIMHRDIKPENILITENGRAKICDFGFSRFAAKTEEEKRRLSYCGTETYMAPEIILCMDFNMSIDIFGYGIILCEMIAGKLAEKAYKRKIPGFEIDPEDVYRYSEKDPFCPEEFVKLAIDCVKYEENERPSWKTIITKLNEIDENIENSYNIGIIPAAGLISNDFLIPLSPSIKGQSGNTSFDGLTSDKKTSSVKSLNIDTEELKNKQRKKYNGRPTSPVLNTRRMSNQYYYYYAVNNPTNDQRKNIYRRLPVYITPPLEHSSIIAIPKDIPKLSLSSPEISDTELTSTLKRTEQTIILSPNDYEEEEEEEEKRKKEKEEKEEKKEKELKQQDKQQQLNSSINTITSSPKDQNNKNLDLSLLTINSSSFTSNSSDTSSPTTSPSLNPYNYNYLKNYAILNNVDQIMKNQVYNNIVLDKSRSTMDMKTKTKIDATTHLIPPPVPPKDKIKNKTVKINSTPKQTRYNNMLDHENSSSSSSLEISEDEDHITNLKAFKNKDTNKMSKAGKYKSLPSMKNDIRLYPNGVQKRRESLMSLQQKKHLSKVSLSYDNDETLTMPDNNNKSFITPLPTIEDIYNPEKEKITGIHHRFSINNIPCLAKCNVCHRRMSLVKRYLACDDCNFRCHAKCSSLAPFSCTFN
jgi:LIM domain kinase 1